MRVIGFSILHYGSDYLKEALLSINHVVDEHYIIYCPVPSFGFNTPMACPDSEEELQKIVEGVPKTNWIRINKSPHEGFHRQQVNRFAKKGDIVLVVDSDELWQEPEKAIESIDNKQSFRIDGFVNFWKST